MLSGKRGLGEQRQRSQLEKRAMLVRLANRHVMHSSELASGQCFIASLSFAHAARKIDDVPLLRWHVRNDPDFIEHWAVRLSETEVLDITRVQVDGDRQALKAINSYPASYRLVGEYPSSMLLAYCLSEGDVLKSASFRQALAMRRAIHRHDRRQPGSGSFALRLRSLANLAHYVIHALVTRFHLKLAARRQQLARRLDARN
jgi:hypothetical protein